MDSAVHRGSRLGRYILLDELAKGGMARVWVAQRDGAENLCVVKQLLGELKSHDTATTRFTREAQVAAFLRHPNIASVLDAGYEGGNLYIAFEFIVGMDVRTIMHRLWKVGQMCPLQVSVFLAFGALRGLAYAHDATDPHGKPIGLVHRDLSPQNIMLSSAGDVKLIDFGVARGNFDNFKTAPGIVLGTLRYVSPEQAVADQVDRRADIYSISVVMHELLTGQYLVQSGTTIQVLESVINDILPPVTALNRHLPTALGPVIAKGLEKNPADRWQTAGEYLAALEHAVGKLAFAPPQIVGGFVRQLFPEQERRAASLLALARALRPEASVESDSTLPAEGIMPTRELEAPPKLVDTEPGPTEEDNQTRFRSRLEPNELAAMQASASQLIEIRAQDLKREADALLETLNDDDTSPTDLSVVRVIAQQLAHDASAAATLRSGGTSDADATLLDFNYGLKRDHLVDPADPDTSVPLLPLPQAPPDDAATPDRDTPIEAIPKADAVLDPTLIPSPPRIPLPPQSHPAKALFLVFFATAIVLGLVLRLC